MKLSYNKNAKDPIYYVQHGFRNGGKATTVNIERIGKHSELLKITDDPLAYARARVEEYNVMHKKGTLPIQFNVDFSSSVKNSDAIYSKSTSKNVGYFFLQEIYQALELKKYFKEITEHRKMTFNCNTINRFLVYGRILDPRSKLGTFDRLDTYYENPDFEYQHILRFMDVLADNFKGYIEHLFKASNNVIKRNTTVCYYDCTNFYFETDDADTEYVDPVTGEIIHGLRQFGISKEHRPNPIVQMGLFMDGNGIPISMCLNPGNQNEQVSAIPAEKEMIRMFDNSSDFIYCADAGLSSIEIKEFNNRCNRKFVVSQSIKGKKVPKAVSEAALNDMDFRLLSSGKPVSLEMLQNFDKHNASLRNLYDDIAYKVIPVEYDIETGLLEKDSSGKLKKVTGTLKTSLVVTFSRKMMEYQRHVRSSQIERAERLVKNNSLDSSEKVPDDVKIFIKQKEIMDDNNKIIKSSYEMDYDRIRKEEMFDGFYAISTNFEIESIEDVREILNINKQRYKIEECFRVMKSYFDSRPAFHHLDNRIVAHFVICYTALLVYKLLEVKLEKQGYHFTVDQILETLKNMKVENIHDLFYKACYTGSDVLTALNRVFPLDLDKENYRPKDINKKIRDLLK